MVNIWIVPAFTITAALIVVLDLLHKVEVDSNTLVHQSLVKDVVAALADDQENRMAVRGARILRALLKKECERHKGVKAGLTQHENETLAERGNLRSAIETAVLDASGAFDDLTSDALGVTATNQEYGAGPSISSIPYDELQAWFDQSGPGMRMESTGPQSLDGFEFVTGSGSFGF